MPSLDAISLSARPSATFSSTRRCIGVSGRVGSTIRPNRHGNTVVHRDSTQLNVPKCRYVAKAT
jgi:hypothetical protein